MNADQIADVILGAIPPIDATNDDPEYAARLKELLERFDLTDAAKRPAKTYSGGMRRRLDLAAALVAHLER